MNDRLFSTLYWPAIALSWLDVSLIGATLFGLPQEITLAALIGTVALAAVLFCMTLLDRPTVRAVPKALERMRTRGKFGPPLLDSEWGLLGSIWHDRRVMWCNRALLIAFIAMLIFQGAGSPSLALLLAFSGYFLTTVLFFRQLKKAPQLAEA